MATPNLSSKERAAFRSKAHHLNPIAHVGSAGVTDASIATVAEAFNNRELIKLKVLESAPGSPAEIADQLRDGIEGVSVVQVIGRIVVLHRPLPEKEDA